MADLRAYLSQIKTASRGEIVRDAVISSAKAMDEYGISVDKISGPNKALTKDDLMTKKQAQTAILTGTVGSNKTMYSSTLSTTSTKAIKASTVYTIWEDINKKMNELLGESD